MGLWKKFVDWLKNLLTVEVEIEEEPDYEERAAFYKEPEKVEYYEEPEREEPERFEMSIYIYCWSYDKSIQKPVKEEFEIHNYATDMSIHELAQKKWVIDAMKDIEKRHMLMHPEADRYPHAKIGFDNIRPSFKPNSKQITIEEYTLFTEWQIKYGRKFRKYRKINESKREVDV